MALDFIFMLTKDDRTVEDALDQVRTVIDLGIGHIGFKDVGLPLEALSELNRIIKKAGAQSYLEVVSLDLESELASVRAALEIGVDYLLGGTHVEQVLPLLKGSAVKYYPFPGRITGHPSVLEGSADEIVASAVKIASYDGVHGLDLLAYRAEGDIPSLMKAVCDAAGKPVIVAGSIDDKARISAVKEAGSSGFTIGSAAFKGAYPEESKDRVEAKSLRSQLTTILCDLAGLEGRLSPLKAQSLNKGFASFSDYWSPKVAGDINGMQMKLAKFSGAFVWHHHDEEDELFLVHKGRLLMKFRDREEVVEEGSFIIVPRGVEHCPVALDGECEVVLLESATTLNTGETENERTVRDLDQVS